MKRVVLPFLFFSMIIASASAQVAYMNITGSLPVLIGRTEVSSTVSTATATSAGAMMEIDARFPGSSISPYFCFGYGFPLALSSTLNGTAQTTSIDDYGNGGSAVVFVGASYAMNMDKITLSVALAGGMVALLLPSEAIVNASGYSSYGPSLTWMNYGLLVGPSISYALSDSLSLYGTCKAVYAFLKSDTSDAGSVLAFLPGIGARIKLTQQ